MRAVLWAATSGIITAAAHTMLLIVKPSRLGPDEIEHMKNSLKAQFDEAFAQAVLMHSKVNDD